MLEALKFEMLRPAHYTEIEVQGSQRLTLGTVTMPDEATIALACSQSCAWAVRQGNRVIALFGIVELFEGKHGYGWCMLAEGIGYAHLALTRFVRGQAEAAKLPRLELHAPGPDIETVLETMPDLDPGQVLAVAMSRSTAEMRWACLLGFKPAHVLRRFGAASETYVLFERLG